MRIEFRPQSFVNNLVLEQFSKDGKTLRRILEVSGKKARTVELTYKQSDFLPTQWYVANYNVIKRGLKGTLSKSFEVLEKDKEHSKSVVKEIYSNNYMRKLTIDINNKQVSSSEEYQRI